MNVKILGRALLAFLVVILTACSANQSNQSNHGEHGADQNQHSQHGQESAASTEVEALWKTENQSLQSKRPEQISIQIQDKAGKPVEKFTINHEQEMHLIVVSKDLSFFDHLHPAYQGKGLFQITEEFPKGGEYKLIADFIPQGGQQQAKHTWIKVSGEAGPKHDLQVDKNFTKVVDGKEITLALENVQPNNEAMLTFSFKDTATQQPITDLEPYLGAVGHVVILSADAKQYIHNHPTEEKVTGPDAKFGTSFPASGVYKIWGQFQHKGKVFIVPFVANVP